jgi:hypothetical protein
MADKFVLALGDGHSIVLGLQERTKADATQLISWMNQGGFGMTFVIATYDGEFDVFLGEDGNQYRPEQGPYTKEAWRAFRHFIQLTSAARRRQQRKA